MSIYDKLHGGPQGSGRVSKQLTAKQFLNLEGNDGYTTPAEFVAYAKSLRPNEVADLEQTVKMTSNNVRIENHLSRRIDRVNREYAFPKFILPKSAVGFKVILEAGMDKFLSDYAEGVITVGFTLDQLVEEAMNQ